MRTPHSTVNPDGELPQRRFDVVVVGAGISGALMAEGLTAMGKSVLILDARPPVRGSTAASTAMIQHEIDVPLIQLRRQIGKDKADRAWLRSARAVMDLVALQERLGIDCAMERKPALYLAGNTMGARAMADEAAARVELGIEAELLGRDDLTHRYDLDRTAAILSTASASANPAQLTAGLLEASLSRDAILVSPVEITDLAELPGGVALATGKGHLITTDHAVFCTGYEFLHQMRQATHSMTSTWALASHPMKGLPGWMKDTIVWEASDPYLYFRTDAAGRIIVGGEDEDAAETNSNPAKLRRKAQIIARKLRDLTGVDIGTPAYAWSAPFGVTTDGLPIIDRVPGHDRIFSVMGFCGNGITFSMMAAQLVLAEINGLSDPDADVFRLR